MTIKRSHGSALSRADLLWSFAAVDRDRRMEMAALLGYEEKPEDKSRSVHQVSFSSAVSMATSASVTESENSTGQTPKKASYYRVIEREGTSRTDAQAKDKESSGFEWFENAKGDFLEKSESSIPEIHRQAPRFQALAPWSRVWPFLYRILGSTIDGVRPDIPKMVDQVASGRVIRRVPRIKHQNWSAFAQILVDINDSNFPYRNDFIHLCEQLKDIRGELGLDIQYLHDEPGGFVVRYTNRQEVFERWRMPESESPLLILSDMGMHAKSRRVLYDWLVFGQQLVIRGCRPTVLMPVAERDVDQRLLRYFDCVVWDRTSRLKPLSAGYEATTRDQTDKKRIETLLAYFFPALRVDAGLLRAVRRLLPANQFDIGHESAIWRHAAISRVNDQWGWQTAARMQYHQTFMDQLKGLSQSDQETLVELLGRFHALFPDELYFEVMNTLITLGVPVPDSVRRATEKFMANLVKSYAQNPNHVGFDNYVKRTLGRSDDPALRRDNDYYVGLMAIEKTRHSHEAKIAWPGDIPAEKILYFINRRRDQQRYLLRQMGHELELIADDRRQQDSDDWGAAGVTLAVLEITDTQIVHLQRDEKGKLVSQDSLNLAAEQNQAFDFPAGSDHQFQIGAERFRVEAAARMEDLDWAFSRAMTSDQVTYAESLSADGEVYRWYWHPPEWQTAKGMLRGVWYPESPQALTRPTWASEIGRDEYGIYADFELNSLVQRMGWIEPGQFRMGSPKDEPERLGDETQHEVILTQGFWLGETTCAQALWKSITGRNPSEFKGDRRPIENISWEDTQRFIDKANAMKPELRLCLPTEAQWEFGCRAGTTTPFSWGSNITPDEVNYNGGFPYADGEKGLYRSETVDVKSLPPNPWGLYEMHGNVWEWCADWYGSYGDKKAIDPLGPASGDDRVLRGGSWISNGRGVRSAYRVNDSPDGRFSGVGLRLARGHELKPVRQVRSNPAASPDNRVAEQRQSGLVGGLRKWLKKTQ